MRIPSALVLLLTLSVAVRAQQPPPEVPAIAAIFEGGVKDSVAARRLLDSIATHAPDLATRGEAAFALARLAPSAAERERILGAFVVDHPFSARVPGALHQLGMIELARNDRDRAAAHLTRYLRVSTPPDTGRLSASLALGRLLVERGDLPRGCAALLVGRSELPETAIELRNQFDFSVARCQGVDTTSKIDMRPLVDTTPAPRRTGAFTVQVAAYDTKVAAERLATRLRGQGMEARVVGTSKPFRVRVGRYATRAAAEEASREVDRVARSRSIVVVVGPEDR